MATKAKSTSPSPTSTAIEMAGDKYQIIKKIGEGAQGIILKAERRDRVGVGEFYAIKKLRNLSDSNGISMDTIREIYMLRELEHDNIISILDIFGFSQYLYVVMSFAVCDLELLIKDSSILLKPNDCKQFFRQLLLGIDYLHHKFILHRDLKPSNCLILETGVLKISDFGLAREYGSPHRQLSYKACTIWYRAVELLFGAHQYSTAMDMWSAGCIFAELLLRVPIFGGNQNDEISQIGRIFKILGTPDNNNWKDAQLLPKFRRFEACAPYNIDHIFKAQSANAKQLFLSLCTFDPNQRLSAKQALQHEYFKEDPSPTPIDRLPLPKKENNSNN